MTFDLVTVLVATGSLVIGALVFRWSAPPSGASSPSRGERLVYAFTAAVAVVALGGYLASGIHGTEHTTHITHAR